MSTADSSLGYVTDSSYEDTFFRELSPAWLNYVAALNGVRPVTLSGPFTYLELGCGLGTSAVINAAASPGGRFYACDLNPAHVEHGRRHAEELGVTNVEFIEASFQELLGRELPSFDFITLHGVYSWVDAAARAAIRDVIRKCLAPGGLVYVSYNCFPGWAVELPIRKLMVELAATASGDSAQRVRHAVQVLDALSRNGLRYFTSHAAALDAVAAYNRGGAAYLAHEFFNATWEPFYSIDVADEMAELGLRYVGSATLADNHAELVMSEPQARAITELPTARQRQLAGDFAANRRFRRDVFVRETGPLTRADVARNLSSVLVGFPGNPARLLANARVPRGELRFQPTFVADLADLLAEGAKPIGEIVAALGADPAEVARNVLFLVAAGALAPFAKAGGASSRPERLVNSCVEAAVTRALRTRTRGVLPSEVLGSGVTIQPEEALAIREFVAGARDEASLTHALEAGLPTASAVAKAFFDALLPALARLGVLC